MYIYLGRAPPSQLVCKLKNLQISQRRPTPPDSPKAVPPVLVGDAGAQKGGQLLLTGILLLLLGWFFLIDKYRPCTNKYIQIVIHYHRMIKPLEVSEIHS